MNPKNIQTSVFLHARRRTGAVAEVELVEHISGNDYPVPGGVIFCEVECIPEVIKALKRALKMAKEEGWFEDDADHSATSGKEGSCE